jgi:hypothetical protein
VWSASFPLDQSSPQGDGLCFDVPDAKHAADPSGLQLRAENDVSLLEDFHVGSAAQSFGFEWRADGERHWIRVDVRDDTGHLALLGNPIYLRAL